MKTNPPDLEVNKIAFELTQLSKNCFIAFAIDKKDKKFSRTDGQQKIFEEKGPTV